MEPSLLSSGTPASSQTISRLPSIPVLPPSSLPVPSLSSRLPPRPAPSSFGDMVVLDRSAIEINLLKNAPLKNEEIIELLAFICSAESIEPYREHVQILQSKYDMTIESRILDLEIFSLREKFPLFSLRNYFVATGDQGFHSLLPDMITTYQNDVTIPVYLRNIFDIFAPSQESVDERFIRDLLKWIDESDMDGPGLNEARRFFQRRLEQISEYAPIPNYIREYEIDVEKLPRLEEKEISSDLPDDLLATYLIDQLDTMDLVVEGDDENVKDVITEKLQQLHPQQREQLIEAFQTDPHEVKALQENRDIFRVYGPVNAYPDTDFANLKTDEDEPDINVIFGGARMFSDMSLEYDYDNDKPMDEWFLGYCLECSRRIRKYHHAVREPRIIGGWRGCYCSWLCVRKFIEKDQDSLPQPNTDAYNVYVTRIGLTREYEQEIIKNGIADREVPEIEDPSQEVKQDDIDDLLKKIPQLGKLEEPFVNMETNFSASDNPFDSVK